MDRFWAAAGKPWRGESGTREEEIARVLPESTLKGVNEMSLGNKAGKTGCLEGPGVRGYLHFRSPTLPILCPLESRIKS